MSTLFVLRTHSHHRRVFALSAAVACSLRLAAVAAQTPLQTPGASTAHKRAADRIQSSQLRDYLTFIASDELGGRDTPSNGLDTAARFLAAMCSRAGLKGGGDNGTFYQDIALKRSSVEASKSVLSINGRAFRPGVDFVPGNGSFFGGATPGSASGGVVYVGHGWTVAAKNINPYGTLDLKGKFALVNYDQGSLPKGISPDDLQGEPGKAYETPDVAVKNRGGVGILFIPRFSVLANFERSAQAGGRSQFQPEKFMSGAAGISAATLGPAPLSELLRGAPQSAEALFTKGATGEFPESFALDANRTVQVTVGGESETARTQNVIAILEGSDPVLKQEFVALGAHYDHVGTRAMGEGDRIFNGADDDGSGTTALLAIAEAVAAGPRPKRSLLFVWHAGEEKGLWGSRFFTESPTVPIEKIVAQLNIDMIGRSKGAADMVAANANLSGPNQIYVIGSKMMSDELGAVSEAVNKSYLKLDFSYKYDDPKDPNRFFYRSDHINYARKGIPIIFYFDGVHEDYHRATDHADKIDYQKMTAVTKTVCATAMALADLPKRPKVDRPLSPEVAGGGRRRR